MTGTLTLEDVSALPCAALGPRGISEEVAAEYGARTEYDDSGMPARWMFPMYKDSSLVGYQVRDALAPGQGARTFHMGKTSGARPFGSQIMGDGGKFIIVCESCEDALAMRQMFKDAGKQYRCVATTGTKWWRVNLEWFEKYDTVVIAYDQDAAGLEAAKEFALALTPGKGRVMTWDERLGKGPGDLLLAGQMDAFIQAVHNAKPLQVSDVVLSSQTWEHYLARKAQKSEYISYPPEWVELCRKAYGLRMHEASVWTGPTGGGKTSLLRELELHILKTTPHRIGVIELEAAVGETLEGLMGLVLNKRIGLPDVMVTDEEEQRAWSKLCANDRLVFLDHRGDFDGSKILAKIRYLVYALGCKVVVLDNLTLAIQNDGDGNGPMDAFTKEIAKMLKSQPFHLAIVAHTRKQPAGSRSMEGGAVADEDDLKGSASLKQIAYDVIAIARDKVAESETERNTNTVWVRKCRATGRSGRADLLRYDDTTGRLTPINAAPNEPAQQREF